jgi:hypothetical protein
MRSLLLCFVLLPVAVPAEDLRSIDGVVYHHTKVVQVDPDGVIFEYDKGIAKVDFHRLPPDVQQRFGFNERKAALYRTQTAQATQDNQRVIKEHEEHELARIQKLMESGASGNELVFSGGFGQANTARHATQLQREMDAREEALVAAAREPRTFWNAPFWQSPVVKILSSFLGGGGSGHGSGGEGPYGNGAGFDNHHGMDH